MMWTDVREGAVYTWKMILIYLSFFILFIRLGLFLLNWWRIKHKRERKRLLYWMKMKSNVLYVHECRMDIERFVFFSRSILHSHFGLSGVAEKNLAIQYLCTTFIYESILWLFYSSLFSVLCIVNGMFCICGFPQHIPMREYVEFCCWLQTFVFFFLAWSVNYPTLILIDPICCFYITSTSSSSKIKANAFHREYIYFLLFIIWIVVLLSSWP